MVAKQRFGTKCVMLLGFTRVRRDFAYCLGAVRRSFVEKALESVAFCHDSSAKRMEAAAAPIVAATAALAADTAGRMRRLPLSKMATKPCFSPASKSGRSRASEFAGRFSCSTSVRLLTDLAAPSPAQVDARVFVETQSHREGSSRSG